MSPNCFHLTKYVFERSIRFSYTIIQLMMTSIQILHFPVVVVVVVDDDVVVVVVLLLLLLVVVVVVVVFCIAIY